MEVTREPQYQRYIELRDARGLTQLGLTTNFVWQEDPRNLSFLLARYKFVAKMLSGKERVLEIGCGDGFGTRLVLQEVGSVCAVDFDPVLVKDTNERMDEDWAFECRAHDMLAGPVDGGPYDAAYAVDVLEHIPRADEHRFVANAARSLIPKGVLILGSPFIQSQAYASRRSKEGHVNCKNHEELKLLAQDHFDNVFIFSMNDEIVHTGFYPMAHYLFALCVGRS
jgi:cyclopropane fatty-acyl-phospholipid synthase-like methyltransferase